MSENETPTPEEQAEACTVQTPTEAGAAPPQEELVTEDEPGTESDLPESEGQPELPFGGTSEAGSDDPCATLRDFLATFDPGLAGTDFHPVETAIERLGNQKEHIESFMKQANEQRLGIEELQAELTQERAKVAQKDVRDERVSAIAKIVSDKIADSAKVMRIQKLLE